MARQPGQCVNTFPFKTMNTIPQSERGFIALIAILIISVVLLASVISVAQFGITGRYILLDLERKAESESRAEACAQVARVAVFNDPAYEVTDKAVPVGKSWCNVLSIVKNSPSSGFSRVEVSASSTGATTNLRATVDTSTGNITRLIELPIL